MSIELPPSHATPTVAQSGRCLVSQHPEYFSGCTMATYLRYSGKRLQ